MLNVSRMPTMMSDSHRLMHIEPDNYTLSKPSQLTWELFELIKVGSNHVGISNTKINSNEYLSNLNKKILGLRIYG